MTTYGVVTIVKSGVSTHIGVGDSSPSMLGKSVLLWARKTHTDIVESVISNLDLINGHHKVHPSDVTTYFGMGLRLREGELWETALLRGSRDFFDIVGLGLALDGSDWPYLGTTEWGYVIDFDAETFEVYIGFQNEEHSRGRYAQAPHALPPLKLIVSWFLDALPSEEDMITHTEGIAAREW